MLTILSPDTFKKIPWKNGLGHTTELAISDGGNLDNFDWRLSIASVENDGDFSNFSGYQRNLVLIEGAGLTLDHRNGDIDKLTKLLDIAHFDGGSNTHGSLANGGIKDFNIMTKQTAFSANVHCYIEQQDVVIKLPANSLVFAYSLTDELNIRHIKQEVASVPVGHLAQLKTQNLVENSEQVTAIINGRHMIIIELKPHN
ncbi:MAG: HutD family protein [Colwellia sp.]|nr:HutD family protein [Colwellia sp.]